MSPTAKKIKSEIKEEAGDASATRVPSNSTSKSSISQSSPATVKRELGEAAEALLLLSDAQTDGNGTSSRHAENGNHDLRQVQSEQNASTSKDRTNGTSSKKKKKSFSDDEGDSDYDAKPAKKKKTKTPTKASPPPAKVKPKEKHKDKNSNSKAKVKDEKKSKDEKKPTAKGSPASTAGSPKKGRKKAEEEVEVWKWWEEKRGDDEIKWKTLQHKGPIFAPGYEPLPKHVKFLYDGKPFPQTR